MRLKNVRPVTICVITYCLGIPRLYAVCNGTIRCEDIVNLSRNVTDLKQFTLTTLYEKLVVYSESHSNYKYQYSYFKRQHMLLPSPRTFRTIRVSQMLLCHSFIPVSVSVASRGQQPDSSIHYVWLLEDNNLTVPFIMCGFSRTTT